MTALLATAAATLIAAVITYAFDRFRQRREAAADALVVALRDYQRSRFLLDLRSEDHATLVTEPLRNWIECYQRNFVRRDLIDSEHTDQYSDAKLSKFSELLEWRMEERESRIKFAIMARARDVRQFARFHLRVNEWAISEGIKNMDLVDLGFDAAMEALVRTVVSIRAPSVLRPVNALARGLPGVRQLLINDNDVRLLVADYPERQPLTPLSRGIARATGATRLYGSN